MKGFYFINYWTLFLLIAITSSCNYPSSNVDGFENTAQGVELIVLGTAQDAGSPQIACQKDCCKKLFSNPKSSRFVSSIGLVDYNNQKTYLFDATPDIAEQINTLSKSFADSTQILPDAVFLTHAHIGHYTGLMYFGREALGAKEVNVYAMPRMSNFLKTNGPWSQLCNLKNISINQIDSLEQIQLETNLSVIPIWVPHRDEFSETVGYLINGPNKKALFIPDIDKWNKWDESIVKWLEKVDYAFLDATFYDGVEINNRDISEIPHPFVIESMELFKNLSKAEKLKVYFIHLNHTNPLLDINSEAYSTVLSNGFNVARQNQSVKL